MSARSPLTSPTPPRRRATAVVSALLATVLVLVGAAAPAAAATKLSVTGPAQINVGSTATLKLQLSRNGKAGAGKVSLQARLSDGRWKTVQRVDVTKGKASVKVKPAKTTTYRLKRGSAVSKVAKVKVAQSWIGFTVASPSIKAGSKVRAKIVLTRKGVRAGGLVTIQRKTGSGWKDAPEGKVKVPSTGTWYVDLAPTSPTTTYRVVRSKLTSKTRQVQAQDWIGLTFDSKKLATSADKATGAITWYAKGKPAKGKVKLQEKVGSGKWTTLRTLDVTKGKATFSVTPTTTRAYRVFVGSLKSTKQTVKVTTVIPKSFTINGSGWGHGIGMSQYGAYAMALAGHSAEEILGHYYTDTAVTTEAVDRTISVQVLGPDADYSGAYDQEWKSTTLSVTGGKWRLRKVGTVNGASTEVTVPRVSSTQAITVKVDGSKVSAYQGNEKLDTASTLRLHWENTSYYEKDSTKTALAKVNGAQGTYRHGRLTIRAVKDTDGQYYINVVNDLRLNTEYLYGIAESPSSWGEKGPAALQAQAIAARNYAASMTSTRSDCKCHLVDDVRDQMFTGWNKENEGTGAKYGKLWKAAVDATVSDGGKAGKVLRYTGSDAEYRGKLVRAYYSSSTGGATFNSEDAWASAVPYLRSVKDPWSLDPASGNPNISWPAELTQAQARSFFGLPDVVSIKVSKSWQGGGVRELTGTSSTGATKSVSGKADAMRTKLNNAATGYVKSAWVKSFTPVGVY